MRFAWNSKSTDIGKFTFEDYEANIIDKDNQKHKITRLSELHYSDFWLNGAPHGYTSNAKNSLINYLERNEYVETDDGVFIPRCNIKSVTFSCFKTRTEGFIYENPGIRDWNSSEWFSVIFMGGFAFFFLTMAIAILIKTLGKA